MGNKEFRLLSGRYAQEISHLLVPDSIAAIETAERFAKGEATVEQLEVARSKSSEARINAAICGSRGGRHFAAEAAHATTLEDAKVSHDTTLKSVAEALASQWTNPGSIESFEEQRQREMERLGKIRV